jgi:DNA polymerase III alpha subunit (gram-positive type)
MIALDDLLADGRPAIVVADRITSVLGGRLLVSDAAEYDMAFLKRLLELRDGNPDRPLIDLAALERRIDRDARDRLRSTLDRLPSSHRAGPDAERLAKAWAAALDTGSG